MKFEKITLTTKKHIFFGYYDINPLNENGKYHLSLCSSFHDREPSSSDLVEIGYFNLDKPDNFIKVSQSQSWNWQQGCMLQWVTYYDKDAFIYNVYEEGKYKSVIQKINGEIIRKFNHPIYAIGANGKYQAILDFNCYYHTRPGYRYLSCIPLEMPDYYMDIKIYDAINDVKYTLITIGDLIKNNKVKSMEGATHYIEHASFSPDATKLAFIHRWKCDQTVFSRLFVIDINGENLKLLTNSGRVSHFSWKNNNEIIFYGGRRTLANTFFAKAYINNWMRKALKSLYRLIIKTNSVDGLSYAAQKLTGDNYNILDVSTAKCTSLEMLNLNKDGHPTFNPVNKCIFATDTYPDVNNNYLQKLLLINLSENNCQLIDEIYSSPECANKSYRSDFHPKWSSDGKFISIDVVENSLRKINVYKIF